MPTERIGTKIYESDFQARMEQEIADVERMIQRFKAGDVSEDEFKRFRLVRGIYGQRQKGVQMYRIKVPTGGLTSNQLRAVSRIAREFAPLKLAHITTRQNFQLHYVKLDNLPEMMRKIAAEGLHSREACGNSVRNVTCCWLAGVSASEAFDVGPVARALAEYFLWHPLASTQSRKFKIAFEGCAADHVFTGIHDIGLLGRKQRENGTARAGFRIVVGGGLGGNPMRAQTLSEFVPVEEVIPACEAVLRVFDKYGNRQNKATARMKFVITEFGREAWKEDPKNAGGRMPPPDDDGLRALGMERFRREWEQEFAALQKAGPWPKIDAAALERKPEPPRSSPVEPDATLPEEAKPAYREWVRTNIFPQRHPDFVATEITLKIGDVTCDQMDRVADLSEKFADGWIRTTPNQNFCLRWVHRRDLPALYRELRATGLGDPSARRLQDVVCCPGGETCQLGITRSKGLARHLVEMLRAENGIVSRNENLTIKVSGCPNSCGQHHIASIGLHGASATVGGKAVPCYNLMIGGHPAPGTSDFGRLVCKVPAKKASQAVKRLLEIYERERRAGDGNGGGTAESFRDWAQRADLTALKEQLKDLTLIENYEVRPDLYRDWEEEREFSLGGMGKGECAA